VSAGCTWVLWIWDVELLSFIIFLRHLTKKVSQWAGKDG